MVVPIKLRRSSTPGAVPTAVQLADGEVAINTADAKLFAKDTGGTVRELGMTVAERAALAAAMPTTGGTFTGDISARAGSGVGKVRLQSGISDRPGILAWHGPDDTRWGYMGWGNGSLTALQLVLEAGKGLDIINGSVSFDRDPQVNTNIIPSASGKGTSGQVLTSQGAGLPAAWADPIPPATPSLGFLPPQGRLTVASGVSVLTSAVSAAATVYFTPHIGRYVPLYDGTNTQMVDYLGELSQALSDTTKSPAAAAANKNYDMFVWLDGATPRLSRGPAWGSDTSPGTGAGTSETELVNGFLVNKVAITNGPAARRGLYVGTIRTNGSSLIDWSLGDIATGGAPANLTVWNAYNQVEQVVNIRDQAASWSYNGAGRGMNNSAGHRINLVAGRGAGPIDATLMCRIIPAGGNFGVVCINLDGGIQAAQSVRGLATVDSVALARFSGQVGQGFHYMQAVEYTGGAAATFYSNSGLDEGFQARWMC